MSYFKLVQVHLQLILYGLHIHNMMIVTLENINIQIQINLVSYKNGYNKMPYIHHNCRGYHHSIEIVNAVVPLTFKNDNASTCYAIRLYCVIYIYQL